MLAETEGLAVEASRHVENRIAVEKALVAERDQDLAFADDLAVEPSDAFVAERRRSALALFGGLCDRRRVKVSGDPGPGDRAMLNDVRQGAGDQLAHRDQPLDVDPGLEAHRLEHEGKIFGDDVAGGAGGVGTTAEPAQ